MSGAPGSMMKPLAGGALALTALALPLGAFMQVLAPAILNVPSSAHAVRAVR